MTQVPNVEPSDECLMARAQEGDSEAFARLYDRHAEPAFRIARSICHDTGRAEDAVQEGFLAIWRSRARYFAETGTFKAWAMKIVYNRALDSYRRAARPQNQLAILPDETPDSTSPSPSDEVIAHGEHVALWSAVQQLPAAQAEVITLAYYGGLSQTEIASQLDLPLGTIKGRMRLGLEKMRVRIPAAQR